MTIVCFVASPTTTTVAVASISVDLAASLDQHDMILVATTDCEGYNGDIIGLTTVYISKISPRCLLSLMQNSSTDGFSFSELSFPLISLCWCLLQSLLSPLKFQCGFYSHQWELHCWVLHHSNPLEYRNGRFMCLLVLVHGPCKGCTE